MRLPNSKPRLFANRKALERLGPRSWAYRLCSIELMETGLEDLIAMQSTEIVCVVIGIKLAGLSETLPSEAIGER